ncbi:Non-histone chromosomal protein 6 [Linderina macrospora]|uniref:Non-histone chromosomal protein 6 n=1 Tax=Linderina macrospora TaxID=4868 RepID=A0ACC1J310_9FUNG|nr:Non-histone chromosomal protein 6 [Linderina macrospora]
MSSPVTSTDIPAEPGKLGASGPEFNMKKPVFPKRPLSAYMYYALANRERIRKENPDARFGVIGKLIGATWSKLSDEDKELFIKQSKDDKERFEAEKAKYIADMDEYNAEKEKCGYISESEAESPNDS